LTSVARSPDVSVVMPTRDRQPALTGALDVLAAQDLGELAVEVVVVDNASRDRTAGFLSERAELGADPFELRPVSEETPGRSVARDTGVAHARSALLLFMTDTCWPAHGDFVARHVAAHRADPDPWFGLVGHIVLADQAATPLMEWLMRSGRLFDYGRLGREPPGPFLFYTNNLSLKKEAYLAVDGHDPRFAGVYGTDYELGLRLVDQGLRLAYDRALLVEYRKALTLRGSLARMQAVGRSANLLNRLHPHRRPPPMPRPVGWRGRVARAIAPLARRLPVPAALPRPVREQLWRIWHFAAFVAGYSADPMPGGRPPQHPSAG
jgi:glycosyltransferase involved in cell wall biosynthesis